MFGYLKPMSRAAPPLLTQVFGAAVTLIPFLTAAYSIPAHIPHCFWWFQSYLESDICRGLYNAAVFQSSLPTNFIRLAIHIVWTKQENWALFLVYYHFMGAFPCRNAVKRDNDQVGQAFQSSCLLSYVLSGHLSVIISSKTRHSRNVC